MPKRILPNQRINEIDSYIGSRLKLRRVKMGLTQERLADALGVTAQQVQKYESGINRMGGSRLLQASQILKISVQYFFEGLEDFEMIEEPIHKDSDLASSDNSFPLSSEISEFLKALNQIKNKKIRAQLLTLLTAILKI